MSQIKGKPLRSYAEKSERVKDAPKPVKKKNEKRGGERFPELRDPDRLAWTRTQPCVISGAITGQYITDGPHPRPRVARIVPAHMRSRGAAGDDSSVLPVESEYHDEQHAIGIKSWAIEHSLNIPALIAEHRKRYALQMADKVKAAATPSGRVLARSIQ